MSSIHPATGTTTPSTATASGDRLSVRASALLKTANWVGKLKHTVRTGWMRRGVRAPESVADHTCRMATLALLYGPYVKKSEVMPGASVPQEGVSTTATVNGEEHSVVGEKEGIDVGRCSQICLIHDLAEAKVGDLVVDGAFDCRDTITREQKAELEAQAIEEILVDRPDLRALWYEYEHQNTPEAVFVKDLDRLEMLIQADEYEDRWETWRAGAGINAQTNEDGPRGGGEREKEKSSGEEGDPGGEDLSDFYRSTEGVFRSAVARSVDVEVRKRKAEREARAVVRRGEAGRGGK